MTVEGRVATVLNDREIAFNVGQADGVRVDDIARVVVRQAIKDPGTGESLGIVTRVIARFRVVEVQERLCVGQTIDAVAPDSEFAIGLRTRAVQHVTDSRTEKDWRTAFIEPGMVVELNRPVLKRSSLPPPRPPIQRGSGSADIDKREDETSTSDS